MSVEKGQGSEINPTSLPLRQNIPTRVVKFRATAGCNQRTCAVSNFGRNLLPGAVSAPAVAICLNSLLSDVRLQKATLQIGTKGIQIKYQTEKQVWA